MKSQNHRYSDHAGKLNLNILKMKATMIRPEY